MGCNEVVVIFSVEFGELRCGDEVCIDGRGDGIGESKDGIFHTSENIGGSSDDIVVGIEPTSTQGSLLTTC